jgi:hypothetical protein
LTIVATPAKSSTAAGKRSAKNQASQSSREYRQRIDRWFDEQGGFCADIFCRDISGLLSDEKFD